MAEQIPCKEFYELVEARRRISDLERALAVAEAQALQRAAEVCDKSKEDNDPSSELNLELKAIFRARSMEAERLAQEIRALPVTDEARRTVEDADSERRWADHYAAKLGVVATAIQNLCQAYRNKHSPQHRASCLIEAETALNSIDAARAKPCPPPNCLPFERFKSPTASSSRWRGGEG